MNKATLFILLALNSGVIAQKKCSFAIRMNFGNAFFHKTAKSSFNNFHIAGQPKLSFGVGFSTQFKLSEKTALISGLNYLSKKYKVNLSEMDFKSSYSFYPTISVLELPVLIDRSLLKLSDSVSIHFSSGIVLGVNKHVRNSFKDNGAQGFDGAVTFFVSENWSTILCPDLYFGSGLVRTNKLGIKQHIGLSYQYGLINIHRFDYKFVFAKNNGLKKEYLGVIHPKLSFLSLYFLLYPKWLNHG